VLDERAADGDVIAGDATVSDLWVLWRHVDQATVLVTVHAQALPLVTAARIWYAEQRLQGRAAA
jgi:hypothetical protein